MSARDDLSPILRQRALNIVDEYPSAAHDMRVAADELDRLRAEVERMRPVIEAAEAWRVRHGFDEKVRLATAVMRYHTAVAALDAGEPAVTGEATR